MLKHKEIYVTPSDSKKVFANMKRQRKDFSGRVIPLFLTMLVQAQQEVDEGTVIPTDTQQTTTIIQPTTSQSQRKQKTKKPRRKDTELPQTSVPTEVFVDEAVYEEMYSNVERVATIATCLDVEHDRGSRPMRQETIGDAAAQTRAKRGRNDQDMFDIEVLDYEEVVAEIEVSTTDPVTIASEVITTDGVKVSTTSTTPTISMDDFTLAKALAALKSAKPMVKEPSVPKAKGIVMQEPKETAIRTTKVPSQGLKDKGKVKMIEHKKPLKKKDQILIDEEIGRYIKAQLQAEFEEEERLARQKEEEAKLVELEYDKSKKQKNTNREDLETLWKLVKAKYGNTKPEEAYESVL
nr:hypothetical protein [Tanacetum cinerariifolium]